MINESEIFEDVIKKIKKNGSLESKDNNIEVWSFAETYRVVIHRPSMKSQHNFTTISVGEDDYQLKNQLLFNTESTDGKYISKNGMDNLYHDSGLEDMMNTIININSIEDIFVF